MDELYHSKIDRMETIVAGMLATGKLKKSEVFAKMAELDMLTTQDLDDLLHDLREEEKAEHEEN